MSNANERHYNKIIDITDHIRAETNKVLINEIVNGVEKNNTELNVSINIINEFSNELIKLRRFHYEIVNAITDYEITKSINSGIFNLNGLFDLTPFNDTRHFADQINATITNTPVNNLTANEVNAGIANINGMLEQYFKMSSIFKTMKPDPVFASMLGSVPRFTPNVGVGSETNKIGEKYEKFKKFMGDINLPSLPNVMPSYVDYDALDIVFTESEDGKMDTKKILDKGVTTQ